MQHAFTLKSRNISIFLNLLVIVGIITAGSPFLNDVSSYWDLGPSSVLWPIYGSGAILEILLFNFILRGILGSEWWDLILLGVEVILLSTFGIFIKFVYDKHISALVASLCAHFCLTGFDIRFLIGINIWCFFFDLMAYFSLVYFLNLKVLITPFYKFMSEFCLNLVLLLLGIFIYHCFLVAAKITYCLRRWPEVSIDQFPDLLSIEVMAIRHRESLGLPAIVLPKNGQPVRKRLQATALTSTILKNKSRFILPLDSSKDTSTAGAMAVRRNKQGYVFFMKRVSRCQQLLKNAKFFKEREEFDQVRVKDKSEEEEEGEHLKKKGGDVFVQRKRTESSRKEIEHTKKDKSETCQEAVAEEDETEREGRMIENDDVSLNKQEISSTSPPLQFSNDPKVSSIILSENQDFLKDSFLSNRKRTERKKMRKGKKRKSIENKNAADWRLHRTEDNDDDNHNDNFMKKKEEEEEEEEGNRMSSFLLTTPTISSSISSSEYEKSNTSSSRSSSNCLSPSISKNDFNYSNTTTSVSSTTSSYATSSSVLSHFSWPSFYSSKNWNLSSCRNRSSSSSHWKTQISLQSVFVNNCSYDLSSPISSSSLENSFSSIPSRRLPVQNTTVPVPVRVFHKQPSHFQSKEKIDYHRRGLAGSSVGSTVHTGFEPLSSSDSMMMGCFIKCYRRILKVLTFFLFCHQTIFYRMAWRKPVPLPECNFFGFFQNQIIEEWFIRWSSDFTCSFYNILLWPLIVICWLCTILLLAYHFILEINEREILGVQWTFWSLNVNWISRIVCTFLATFCFYIMRFVHSKGVRSAMILRNMALLATLLMVCPIIFELLWSCNANKRLSEVYVILIVTTTFFAVFNCCRPFTTFVPFVIVVLSVNILVGIIYLSNGSSTVDNHEYLRFTMQWIMSYFAFVFIYSQPMDVNRRRIFCEYILPYLLYLSALHDNLRHEDRSLLLENEISELKISPTMKEEEMDSFSDMNIEDVKKKDFGKDVNDWMSSVSV